MQIITSFVLVLIVATGIAACSPGTAGAQNYQTSAPQAEIIVTKKAEPVQAVPADQQTTHVIEIYRLKFQTKLLNVKIGDTVTWINKDVVPHTATANDKSWDSGRLNKGERFSLTIRDQTSLDYFCLYHRQMKAKLVMAVPAN